MIQYSEEAEKSVLGAILSDGTAITRIISTVIPNDFYIIKHRQIFEAILELFEQSVVIDIVTVGNKLKEKIDELFLVDLTSFCYSSTQIESYAKIIKEHSILRQLKIIGENLAIEAQAPNVDAFDLLSEAENKLMEVSGILRIRQPEPISKLIHPVVEMLDAIKRGERKTIGIQTGIYRLDEYLSGFQNGDLITIAARPSIGKTSLAMTIAKNISLNDPVGFFSLEMSNEQLLIRLLSMESGMDSKSIREGKYPEVEFIHLHKAITKVYGLKFYIDDQSRQSVLEIKAKTKRMLLEYGIKVIFVDYLQLMSAPKAETRDREIGKLTAGLKEMAKEFNIPVIVMAQLSRATEARETKRPELSDLRESGNIEQDSDIVLFIHRPEFYRKDTFEDGKDAHGVAEIVIAKHRNGKTGLFDIGFKKEITSFFNLTQEKPETPDERSNQTEVPF